MDNNEIIASKIAEIDLEIGKIASTFILSKELKELGLKRLQLQEMCTHKNSEGFQKENEERCIYCGKVIDETR